MKFIQIVNKIGLQLSKHSPEILTVTAIVGTVGAVATAIKSTTDVDGCFDELRQTLYEMDTVKGVINPRNEEEHEMHDKLEAVGKLPVYTAEQERMDKVKMYTKLGWTLAKHYWKTIAFGAVAIGSVLALHKVLNARYLSAVAALTSTQMAFDEYRKTAVAALGQELPDTEVEKIDRELKEEAAQAMKKDYPCHAATSFYAKWFDETSPYFRADSAQNLMTLRMFQGMANDKLTLRGHLFLNEVYEMLGLPHTKEGAVVGWIVGGPRSGGYVDFNLYNRENGTARDFINGWEKAVLLDFNVDGVIYDLI